MVLRLNNGINIQQRFTIGAEVGKFISLRFDAEVFYFFLTGHAAA